MKEEQNQQAELEYLYRKMHGKLLIYANSVLKDNHHAEEAVQDTFRIACEKVEDLLNSNNPQG